MIAHKHRWILLAGIGCWISLMLAVGCGAPQGKITAALSAPQSNTFNKGLVQIKARIDTPSRVKRAAIVIRHMNDQVSIQKELVRQETPQQEWDIDWDTSKEKDGPYEVELQLLLDNGQVQQHKVSNVWIVNKPAQLVIKECTQPPVVARDKLTLTLDWKDVPKDLPPSTVQLFLQGGRVGEKSKAPYVFELDLSKNPDGAELYLNAVATRGIYSGSSSVCSIRIDRQGPRVRFLYPEKDGDTIPGKFSASVEVEEEFGVKEVRITVAGQVVGRLNQPPYQVPVDLTKSAKDGDTITLQVIGVDAAGNESEKPQKITVKVDTKAPNVIINKPEENKNFPSDIVYDLTVQDSSGLGFIDLYILDEKGNRVDNILHRDGEKKTEEIKFSGKINTPISRYGTGIRKLEVVARDVHGNVTTISRSFIIGCKTPQDCPTSPNPSNPYLCLGNRCIIPRDRGERCTYDFSCKPPLICHFGGLSYCAKEKLGICRQPCQPSKNECHVGEFCMEQKSGPSICFPGDACGPFTYNCAKNEQCTPWGSDSFVCLPTGFAKEGEPCKPYACDNTLNCGKNLLCIPTGNGNGNIGDLSKGVCRKICDQEFPTRDCTGQQICDYLTLRDTNSNSVGYCQVPKP